METQPFNERQREAFACMLEQAKERAQEDLRESSCEIRERVESDAMLKLVEEQGGTELFDRLKQLNDEVGDVEKHLERLGFEYRYGQLTLSSDASKTLRRQLKAAKFWGRKEAQLPFKKFDQAILGVWAAETAEDARKIVEGLL
jgi:hypothetical protein